MRWVEISVEATEESADAVTNILMEEGCGGTATCPSSVSSLQSLERVMGYLPVDDRLEQRLDNIRARVKMLPEFGLPLRSDEITIKWVQDEDWATAWKKFFKPLRVGKIIIKPSWEEFSEEPGDVIVEIDPGMAFGTGQHPTTQLCLLILQDYIKGNEDALDMGAGSAILSIAAAKLGAANVTGIDVDPVAVEVAQANVEHSGLENKIKIVRGDSPRQYEGSADIIIANIIAAVLVNISEDLFAKLKPGGKLISSGIIVERANEVRDKYESIGLRTIEEKRDGDWVALISERVE